MPLLTTSLIPGLRWIVLYNANVDRAPENRHTVEQLRIELRRAEEAEQKTRKEVVDDPVAYQVRPLQTSRRCDEQADQTDTSSVA